jgi:hypothetical protein
MNNSFPRRLLVTWQPGVSRLSLTFLDLVATNTTVFDATPWTEQLWADYSTEVWKRFRRVFPKAALLATGLPTEVIENHLLVDVYRPEAFPALLAERLAQQIAARLWLKLGTEASSLECVVILPTTAGPPERLLPLLRIELMRHLQSGGTVPPRTPPPTNGNLALMTGWLGALAGVGVTALNLARLAIRKARLISSRDVLSEHLFVLFSGLGNHTRHIWRWLDSGAAPRDNVAVLVLGQTALEPELTSRCALAGIRVFHLLRLGDLPVAIVRLLRDWAHLSRLTLQAASDIGLTPGLGFHARMAAWWLRGRLHEAAVRRLRFANPGDTLAVFGLGAHADSRLADLALRRRGIKTIHWLHGIVEDPLQYRANSTACLCQNPVDADLCAMPGDYDRCLAPMPDIEAITPSPSRNFPSRQGVLVVTNLLHPNNRFSGTVAREVLTGLLEVVAGHFGVLGISPMTWRPHPRENATPEFALFQQMAAKLGFTVDNGTPLLDQVRRHRFFIATFSGGVGDLAAAGVVPAVFAGLPYETNGHWGRLPAELKFRTAGQLAGVLHVLEDETNLVRLRDQLCAQYNQPPATPQSIGAAIESARISPTDLRDKPARLQEIVAC